MPLVLRLFITLFIVVAGLGTIVPGQAGSVDPTFNAVPSNPLASDISFQQIIQPDGKVIVYKGPSMLVNGQPRSGVFRLNPDGSLDQTFTYNNEGGVTIQNAMLAPDAKIILAGLTSPNHAKMIRLNADGSLDNAFSVFSAASGPPELSAAWFTVQAVQPDGKVIAVKGSWLTLGPFGTGYSYEFARYNLDGTVDPTLGGVSLPGGHIVSTTAIVRLLPDGRFYLAVTSRNHLGGSLNISRRLANGTEDATYTPFSTTFGGGTFLSIEDLSVAVDGGVLATGVFVQTGVGFPPQQQVRKFLPSGSPAGFNAPLVFSGSRVYQLTGGKVLYSASGGAASRPLMRLEADGSIDSSYVLDPVVTSIKNTFQVDTMNRAVFLAQTATGPRLVRLLENGGVDSTFNPSLASVGTVSVVAVQPGDKLIVGGLFSHMNGTPRPGLARVNSDGSVDATFDPGTGFSNVPIELLALPDGKVLAMGDFVTYNGASVPRIIRLNSNGSIDGTFNAAITANAVVSAAIQADGKIIVSGTFTSVNGVGRTGIARLDSNGALDETFNPVLGMSSGGIVTSVVTEPDGKVTFAGRFTLSSAGQIPRTNLARVLSSGAMDVTFDGLGVPQSNRVYRQPDGRYVTLDGNGGSNSMMRRNSNGTPDATFVAPIFSIPNGSPALLSLLLRPDGSMLVGGFFSMVGVTPRSNLVRLATNGSLDPFFLSTGTNATVRGIAASQTGKVVIAGDFTTVDNIPRVGIARLNVPDFRRNTPFDFDGDGRSDFTVFRPSTNTWYILRTSDFQVTQTNFGLAGDIVAPADFDGDGRTDLGIYRPASGDWWYAASSLGGAHRTTQHGISGDIPRPSDFDGDGKADFIVYRPSNFTWYRKDNLGNVSTVVFGAAGDQPLVGDFDGDGKSDPAVFRPSTGDWWYAASSLGGAHRVVHWGANGDLPAPADYDGDGKTDFAVFRPSEGGWYVNKSASGQFISTAFGLGTDRPIPGDYDGDGSSDIAVFRPSTGVWYLLQSTAGFGAIQWGVSTDVVVPNAFVP